METKNFQKVCKRIMRLAPPEMANEIKRYAETWQPNLRRYKLLECIRKYVRADSSNNTTVQIYAAAFECSVKEMEAAMVRAGA